MKIRYEGEKKTSQHDTRRKIMIFYDHHMKIKSRDVKFPSETYEHVRLEKKWGKGEGLCSEALIYQDPIWTTVFTFAGF